MGTWQLYLMSDQAHPEINRNKTLGRLLVSSVGFFTVAIGPRQGFSPSQVPLSASSVVLFLLQPFWSL